MLDIFANFSVPYVYVTNNSAERPKILNIITCSDSIEKEDKLSIWNTLSRVPRQYLV